MQLSDLQLEKALNDGDETAFEAAFRQYYRPLCSYVSGMINDLDESEEIVQQLFADIWEKRRGLAFNTSFKGYLYKAAHNSALNRIKHGKVRQMHAVEHKHVSPLAYEHADVTLNKKELEKKITSAIDSLPEQCRMVFKLSRFEELKYSEIAELLDISIKTVENHMGKALKLLRGQLKDYITVIALFFPWLFI